LGGDSSCLHPSVHPARRTKRGSVVRLLSKHWHLTRPLDIGTSSINFKKRLRARFRSSPCATCSNSIRTIDATAGKHETERMTSNRSAGIVAFRYSFGSMELLLIHPGGHSGQRKMPAAGRYRKVSTRKARTPSPPQSGSSRRRPASRPPATSSNLVPLNNRVGRSYRFGPSRTTSTSVSLRAICSRSSGRPGRATSGNILRPIAPDGSGLKKHAKRLRRARSLLSMLSPNGLTDAR
jgi:hypothetical protein